MRITAGILFYLLNRYDNMQHICHGADRMKLSRTEHFRSQPETETGVLYIYSDKKGVLLFCSKKRTKTSSVLVNALKESDNSYSSLWIPFENLEDVADRRTSLADEVSEFVIQVWNYFGQIQNEILESMLAQEKLERVMEKIKGLLRIPFMIVDRDMLPLYQHPDVPQLMEERYGDDYESEIVEELLRAKEFHEVAKYREPFYYEMKNLGMRCYCINIENEGYYYARLVVYVEAGRTEIPSGAEQITEYVAGVIVQMIRIGSLRISRNQDDKLHLLCIDLLNGRIPGETEFREAVSQYGWEANHTFQAICMEPYNATGWETQLENTMPVMSRKLEQSCRQSCAVFSGKQMLWLVNRTLSDPEMAQQDFFQQLSVLLRENVFRAGISSEFRDIALLPGAKKEAEAALEIGTNTDSSYWYYRFDDYRLSYMIRAVTEKGIDPILLAHPSISALMEYDRKHESQLAETLRMFVEKRGNVSQAADALYIHRTTLFRRLNQIKDMTGLDLEDMELMLELQLSYRILNI